MDRLQHAKCLVITFNHLLVYSAKYGVRRHCTKLVVRPPVGCIHASTPNEPDAIQLMLPELIGRRKTALVEDEENDQEVNVDKIEVRKPHKKINSYSGVSDTLDVDN